MTKTIAAIVSAIGVIVLWVVCLRLLLQDAHNGDPGAYAIAGFVFLLLPSAAAILVVALAKERGGYWNDMPRPPEPTQPPMIQLTKHGDTWR